MRAQPIRQRFDQRRTFAVAGALDRPVADGIDRQRVVAVDQHAHDSLTKPFLGQCFAGGLARSRHADRPVVVLDEQDRLGVEDASEIQRLEEIALRRGAVAHRADRHVRLILLGEAHPRADGV